MKKQQQQQQQQQQDDEADEEKDDYDALDTDIIETIQNGIDEDTLALHLLRMWTRDPSVELYFRTMARELIETYTTAVPPKEIDYVVRRSSSQRSDVTTDKSNGKQQVDDEENDDEDALQQIPLACIHKPRGCGIEKDCMDDDDDDEEEEKVTH
jgi:hypothetical protein